VKKILLLLSVILILNACSSNRAKKPEPEPPVDVSHPFEAPAWLWQIPSGSYAIGTAVQIVTRNQYAG